MRLNSLVKHRRFGGKIGIVLDTLPHVGIAIVHWLDDKQEVWREQRFVDLQEIA